MHPEIIRALMAERVRDRHASAQWQARRIPRIRLRRPRAPHRRLALTS